MIRMILCFVAISVVGLIAGAIFAAEKPGECAFSESDKSAMKRKGKLRCGKTVLGDACVSGVDEFAKCVAVTATFADMIDGGCEGVFSHCDKKSKTFCNATFNDELDAEACRRGVGFALRAKEKEHVKPEQQDKQESWKLVTIPANDQSLSAVIEEHMRKGFLPAGVSFVITDAKILFIQDDAAKIMPWKGRRYRDIHALKNGLTEHMDQGYVLCGVAFDKRNSSFYAIYAKYYEKMTRWLTIASEIKSQAIKDDLSPVFKQGAAPIGVTVVGRRFLTIMANVKGKVPKSWSMTPAAPTLDGVRAAIEQNAKKGRLPTGLYWGANANIIFTEY